MEGYTEEHYLSLHEPIEAMQANMTHEQFIGFLRGNIIKYACRMGAKKGQAPVVEAHKIKRYAEWLEEACKGHIIDPRKH